MPEPVVIETVLFALLIMSIWPVPPAPLAINVCVPEPVTAMNSGPPLLPIEIFLPVIDMKPVLPPVVPT